MNLFGLGGKAKAKDELSSKPPLSRFMGPVRQVRSADLDPVQKLALQFGFPLFSGRPGFMAGRLDERHAALAAAAGPGATEVSRFARRRYSGDSSSEFPRSRYYHVASMETFDTTLADEINAYAIPMMTGYACAVQPPNPSFVHLVFRGMPGEPNPLYAGLREPSRFDHVFTGSALGNPFVEATKDVGTVANVPDANQFIVPIPVLLTVNELEACLDLREPGARKWVAEFFADPPAGLYGDALRVLAKAHAFDLKQVKGWHSMLPVVYAQTQGGNPLTDILGTYLRASGCNALVFPSARSETYAIWREGKLVNFAGWNLVSYLGAPMIGKVGIDIGNRIEPLAGQWSMIEPPTGPDRGSLICTGARMLNRVKQQLEYEQLIAAQLPRWLDAHDRDALYARGYFWHAKKRTILNQDPELLCASCNTTFTGDALEISDACPKCSYRGDA